MYFRRKRPLPRHQSCGKCCCQSGVCLKENMAPTHWPEKLFHGQQLSSKAATIIIEKMIKNEYDELENSCLSIDQLFRTLKNRNIDSGPAVKNEPQMIIVENTRSKENFVNTITTSSNLKRSLNASTLNENGQNNKLLKTMIEAAVQERLKRLLVIDEK
ncbi:unnamed protein product [Didymodactylos carnosus]|uniref:Uncharacterized protein n=2 Tax=Didymodactylos carnosus TaxID=1234261 RepID=A0A815W412_9BILA|nr:unnamed protein product [Didymodactylos carnosus]CAF4395872.1 unnamed protein product [Didymodactylos carnosus]